MTTGRLVSGEMPATPFLHQDYFRAVRLDPDQYRRLILRLHPSEPPNGGLDGGEGHEGGQGLGKVLEDLGEAAISPEPREGVLDPISGVLAIKFCVPLPPPGGREPSR